MSLKRLVVHQIAKESQSKEVVIVKSNDLNEVDSNSQILVRKLRDIYKSDNVLYAEFDYGESKFFPNRYREYLKSNKADSDFISLTNSLTDSLSSILEMKTMAKGGYLVYSEYISNQRNFTTIFLVRDTEGVIFHKNSEGGFSIDNITYVNTDKLAMACKINQELLIKNSGDRYLSLTRRNQQREISDYFIEWVGLANSESGKEYTENLHTIIKSIERPINESTNDTYTLNEFREVVHSYIKNQPAKVVNINELSLYLYKDKDKITRFATENEIPLDTEFRANSRVLGKFVNLQVNRDGISLKFSRTDLNDKVRISDENPAMVIIESKKFADGLRSEI